MSSLTYGEVAVTLVGILFSVAFAAWAKRLDKALDLLEKIQEQGHQQALITERRLVRLESHAAFSDMLKSRNSDDDDG